jgi:hypothetical protein
MRILTSIFALLLAAGLHAQKTPEDIVTAFFNTLQSENSDAALDQLYATNPWMSMNMESIQSLKDKMAGLTEDFVGTMHGYDLIVEKSLTDRYRLLSYLARYDRQPIRFTFQFYRPADTWKIYSFKYDGSLDDELEEAAKMYYLDLEPKG